METNIRFVGILIQMIDPCRIERCGAALDAVNDISFCQQQLGEISAVLARNSGNERNSGSHQRSVSRAEYRPAHASQSGHVVRPGSGAEIAPSGEGGQVIPLISATMPDV